MARTTYVKKAQKDQGSCYKCHKPIKAGDGYKWFANRIGRSSQKKKFCLDCQIRPSDQTTSGNLATLYGAIEGAEDDLQDVESLQDIAGALERAAEGARETASMYEESAQNIEDGFGHSTYQSEEIQEKAQECESFADELESIGGDIEGLEDPWADLDEIASELGIEPTNPDDDEENVYDDDDLDTIEQARETRREDAVSQAEDALSNCPL